MIRYMSFYTLHVTPDLSRGGWYSLNMESRDKTLKRDKSLVRGNQTQSQWWVNVGVLSGFLSIKKDAHPENIFRGPTLAQCRLFA